MTRSALALALAAGIAAAASSTAQCSTAQAAMQVYQYRIEHPRYGDIGTYTNRIDRDGGDTIVQTELHVLVRIFGIPAFVEDATRSETWRGGRLVGFRGVTVTNGKRLELRGEARGGGFAITSPSGTRLVPATVRPSNPWPGALPVTGPLMSTKTGEVVEAQVRGGTEDIRVIDGVARRLRKYVIDSDRRQIVWLDGRGTPVAFQSQERGSPVDFVLIGYRPPDSEIAAMDESAPESPSRR